MTNDDRQRGLDRLRDMMAEQGVPESGGHEDGLENPVSIMSTIQMDELVDDLRTQDVVCAICLGTMHRRRRVRLTPVEYAHRICASQPQVDEAVLRLWLAAPRPIRRIRLTQHYGLDPASRQGVQLSVEWVELYEDASGGVLAVVPRPTFGRRVKTVGVPNCLWSVLADRGPAS